jgi:hypothetical protein
MSMSMAGAGAASGASGIAGIAGDDRAEKLVAQKHAEYLRASRIYQFMYYALRLTAGLSAGLLPFVVSTSPAAATALSIVIVVVTVLDMVFNPKQRWGLFSRASDLMTVERLRLTGEIFGYEALLSQVAATEAAKLEVLVSNDEIVRRASEIRPLNGATRGNSPA